MRVLWASHIIPYPPKSGVHLRSYNLLRGVAAKHDVDLLAFIQDSWLKIFYGSREAGLEECERQLLQLCRSVRFLSIDNLTRPAGKWRTALEGLIFPQSYTIRWLQSWPARQAFAESATAGTYALAHFDTVSLAPFRPLFGRTPSTLGHHNIESHMLLRRAENEGNILKRRYFLREGKRVERYEARVAGSFAAHITCSTLDCDRLRAIAPRANAIAIPNGVDVDYFRPTARESSDQSIIFIGSLNWYPNVDAVLFLLRDVWPLLKARVPKLRLDIVGSAPPPIVLQLAAPLRDVKVHGFVNDVRPLMDAATVYVCPIRDGGGTKLKILDAFAMRKCVVAHPIACEGIDITPGRDVQLAESPQAFVEAVERLLQDPGLRGSMGDAARQLVVNRYAFSQIGERLCEVFEAVAAGGGADRGAGGLASAEHKLDTRQPSRPSVLALTASGDDYTTCFHTALRKLGFDVRDADWSGRWLYRNVRRGDIVTLHWPSFLYYVPDSTLRTWKNLLRFAVFLLALRLRGAKIVWTAHNLYPHDGGRAVLAHRLARRLVVAVATFVCVHGERAAATVRREFGVPPASLVVLQHGNWVGFYPNEITRQEARRRLGIAPDAFVFLFLGLCKPYKNLEYLVRSHAVVPDDSLLWIVGRFQSPTYYEEIKRAAKESPDRTTIKDEFVSVENMQVYLNACDVVVLPYREILTSGTAMLALSFGRPVVAPRLGALQELVTSDCGVLYEPTSNGALKQAMLDVRARRFDAARVILRAQQFSWERSAETFAQAITGK